MSGVTVSRQDLTLNLHLDIYPNPDLSHHDPQQLILQALGRDHEVEQRDLHTRGLGLGLGLGPGSGSRSGLAPGLELGLGLRLGRGPRVKVRVIRGIVATEPTNT